MKNLKFSTILLILLLIIIQDSFSQILISDDTGTADASAILEIRSDNKGVLIPRMDSPTRENILSPAQGLLVFDTTIGSFFIYGETTKGTPGWIDLSTNANIWKKSGNNIFLSDDSYNVGIGTSTPSKKFVLKAENQNDTLFEILDSYGKPLMIITPTLTKFYFNETNVKGTAGGFAVGRYASAKATNDTALFLVTPDSTRVYTDGSGTKGTSGGFAVGRYATAKGGKAKKYFYTGIDSTRVYTDGSGTKGTSGGFAVGRYATAKNDESTYMHMTEKNYFIGHKAGTNTTPGTSPLGLFNLFFGYESAIDNTIGYQNTFIGHNTGHGNIEGYQNVFVGSGSGYNNSYGVHNLFAGYRSGTHNVGIQGDINSGSHNVFLGYEAGFENTTGADNVMVGWLAGHENTTAGSNICFGSKAGYSNTVASNNIFMGEFAGEYHTEGTNNIYLGFKSGQGDDTNFEKGYENVFIGNSTGALNQTGYQNVFVGNSTGATNTTGNFNVFVGNESGFSNTTGIANVFLGLWSGASNTTGGQNTFLGTGCGSQNKTGQNNVFIGVNAGENHDNNNNNVYIGNGAGKGTNDGGNPLTTYGRGYKNVFVGYQSGYNSTTGFNNVFVGTNSGHENTTGKENVFIGENAGAANTIGFYNTAIGTSAGKSNSTSAHNTYIGWGAGEKSTAGGNTFIGGGAGRNNTDGSDNVIIGDYASFWSTGGSQNVIIGQNAAQLSTGGTVGSGNVLIGYEVAKNESNISNKLFIDNSNTSTPLIWGDFENDSVKIFGELNINDAYTFPNVDGTNEQVLITDGSGNVSWSSTGSLLSASNGVNIESGVIELGGTLNETTWTFTGNSGMNYWINGTGNFGIYDGTAWALMVEDNGNVGVGTGTPGYKLDVFETTNSTWASRIFHDGNSNGAWGMQIQAGKDDASGTNYMLYFYDGDGDLYGGITASGNTVNYNSKSAKLSQKGLKKYNKKATSILKNIDVVEYKFSEASEKSTIGFIGENIMEIIPESTFFDEENKEFLTDKSALVPILTKAIQEQQVQIESQNSKIESLEQHIQELKTLIQNK